MSSSQPQAGKHRASKARRAPKAALKTSLTLSSMAVVATGFFVGGGAFGPGSEDPATTSSVSDLTSRAALGTADLAAEVADAEPGEVAGRAVDQGAASVTDEGASSGQASVRGEVVTRSDSRAQADPVKKDLLDLGAGNTMARSEDLSDEDPRDIARALLAEYGWDSGQFGCLDSLWTRESGWNPSADNPTSSAYGIPQALPGSKMSSAGADWATNPVTQIKWGLGYIRDRYGSPCAAWGHSEAQGFY